MGLRRRKRPGCKPVCLAAQRRGVPLLIKRRPGRPRSQGAASARRTATRLQKRQARSLWADGPGRRISRKRAKTAQPEASPHQAQDRPSSFFLRRPRPAALHVKRIRGLFCSAPRRGAIGRAYGGPSSVFEFLFLGFGYWIGHRYRNRYRDRKKKKATGTIAIPMAIPNSDTDSNLDGSNPKASTGREILNLTRILRLKNERCL